MSYLKTTARKSSLFALIFIALILSLTFAFKLRPTPVAAEVKTEPDCDASSSETGCETETIKVLIIEINPILTSITNTSLYPNNDGHPKASEYFNQDTYAARDELIEDFKQTSHGYINIETTYEYLNEFPTYTSTLTRSDGTTAHSFDEDTYLNIVGRGDRGHWYSLWQSSLVSDLQAYTFDYNYIINKFDLVNRRNNKEFDQVWLYTTDPALTYETMMVGRNAFWINGSPLTKECDNFIIANISISRRDANFHAFGHGLEGIMSKTFDTNNTAAYTKDAISADFSTLNLWQKFTLTDYNSTGEVAGVGTIHFPFNGEADYDYSNTKQVKTNWREWLTNYPNISGNFEPDNNQAWLNLPINASLDSSENQNPDRLFSRFFFYLFPHFSGRNSDGYYNNWWKYFASLDYITMLDSASTNLTVTKDDVLTANLKTTYYSGKTETIENIPFGDNVTVSNSDILDFSDSGSRLLYGKNIGSTELTLKYDNKTISFDVAVCPAELPEDKSESDIPEECYDRQPEVKPKPTPISRIDNEPKSTVDIVLIFSISALVATIILSIIIIIIIRKKRSKKPLDVISPLPYDNTPNTPISSVGQMTPQQPFPPITPNVPQPPVQPFPPTMPQSPTPPTTPNAPQSPTQPYNPNEPHNF